MPIFYALMWSDGSAEYITGDAAGGLKGEPLLNITGFGSYGAPNEDNNRYRDVLGPILPDPSRFFKQYVAESSTGPSIFSERLTITDSDGFTEPPGALLVEFGADSPFDPGFSSTRRAAFYVDGFAILDFADFSGSGALGMDYLKVWVMEENPPSEFWGNFILAAEVL